MFNARHCRNLAGLFAACILILLPQAALSGEPEAEESLPVGLPALGCEDVPGDTVVPSGELYEVVSANRIILKSGVEDQEVTNERGLASLLLTYESDADGVVVEPIDCICRNGACPKQFCFIEKDGPFGRVCIGDCLHNDNSFCSNCKWSDESLN